MTVINGRKRYGPDTDDSDVCAHCKDTGTWKGKTRTRYCECPIGKDLQLSDSERDGV